MAQLDLDALSLSVWTAADGARRRAVLADVAVHVGGALIDVDGVPAIALRGAELVLIPGATVTLGWDESRAHGLTDEQLGVHRTADDGYPLTSMLPYYFTRTREVTLAPFLLEIAPRSTADWAPALGDDLLAGVAARLAGEGFRLASDDEWEHAARGGTTTVFRWGDAWPDGVPLEGETTFTGHLAPATFGIHHLSNPYQVEVVGDALGFRGGDGGSAVCGGRPAPEAWITFASAFRWPRADWEELIDVALESGFVRRALSLTP
jgi:hypothetical protein